MARLNGAAKSQIATLSQAGHTDTADILRSDYTDQMGYLTRKANKLTGLAVGLKNLAENKENNPEQYCLENHTPAGDKTDGVDELYQNLSTLQYIREDQRGISIGDIKIGDTLAFRSYFVWGLHSPRFRDSSQVDIKYEVKQIGYEFADDLENIVELERIGMSKSPVNSVSYTKAQLIDHWMIFRPLVNQVDFATEQVPHTGIFTHSNLDHKDYQLNGLRGQCVGKYCPIVSVHSKGSYDIQNNAPTKSNNIGFSFTADHSSVTFEISSELRHDLKLEFDEMMSNFSGFVYKHSSGKKVKFFRKKNKVFTSGSSVVFYNKQEKFALAVYIDDRFHSYIID